MNSDMTMFNSTFVERQRSASSLKNYKILADFDGLLIAIDLNNPTNLYFSDKPNGRIVGYACGKHYDIDGFVWIWSIHLDTLRSRLKNKAPNWYDRQSDMEGKGKIKEAIQFIKDNFPV